MKLSQSVTYAIHAALRLAVNGNSSAVSCGQLAREGSMPERFLLQILRDLAKQGILQSSRGGRGGFRLQRRVEDVSVLDIIEAVDGPQKIRLPANLSFPQHSHAVLEATLLKISDATRRQLGALKLSNLLEPATDERADEEHAVKSADAVRTLWPIVGRIAG